MANPTKSITTSFVLLAACCIAGCSDIPAPHPQNQQLAKRSAAAPTLPAPAEMTLTVQMFKLLGGVEMTESMETFPDPDSALVEKKVRAIDWQNAQRAPSVQLGRSVAGGIRYLRIKGTRGTTNADRTLRAYWLGMEDGAPRYRESPPLESLDAAIALLSAFRNDDPKLQTLVPWKVME